MSEDQKKHAMRAVGNEKPLIIVRDDLKSYEREKEIKFIAIKIGSLQLAQLKTVFRTEPVA